MATVRIGGDDTPSQPTPKPSGPTKKPEPKTKAQPKRANIPWKLILGALLVLGAIGYWRYNSGTDDGPRYITALAARGDIEETVLATGVLKPKDLVAAGSQVSGRILSVEVELGQLVKKGDTIAQIDSVAQKNRLRTAEAELARFKAQRDEKQADLQLAELTLGRHEKMIARGYVSEAEVDSAKAEVAKIKAQIAALEAQILEAEVAVETATADLGYTTITAPSDGAVLAIVTKEGTTVNAVQSSPTIAVLGRLDVMVVRVEISEVDIVNVEPGQPVWFTILGAPERRFQATLRSIEPAPESITSDSALDSSKTSSSSSEAIYYIGVFEAENPDGVLRPYMTAEANIVLGSAEQALLIPATALGARGDDGLYDVRVLTASGELEHKRVATGLTDKIRVEVLSGLDEADTVIIGEGSASASSSSTRMGGPPQMGF